MNYYCEYSNNTYSDLSSFIKLQISQYLFYSVR